MKEKDFMSLPINKQKEKINEFVTSWCNQDPSKRCAIVILSNREDEKDAGTSSCAVLGPGSLIVASFSTTIDTNELLKNIATFTVINSLKEFTSNKTKKEEYS